MNKIIINIFILLWVAVGAMAQTATVTGTVTDDMGPVIGATVTVQGTSIGATTDLDGKFTLTGVSNVAKAVLIVRYVGMEEAKEPLKGRTSNINIHMKEAVGMLDDVVVIGYGTQKRGNLTGSIASVSGKILEKVQTTSAAEAIVGKLPGVQVTAVDGSPDAEIKILVRGGGSITQDNSPLIILDGFEVGSLNDVPPTDIESIEVLKDAASTAIYGARGANGVILVTTKRPVEGRVVISLNTYVQTKELSNKLDVMDPYEFVLMQYENARQKSSNPTAFNNKYGHAYEHYIYQGNAGKDWQDEVFGSNPVAKYVDLSVNGGTEKAKYKLSFIHQDQPSVMVGNGLKQNNMNASFNFKPFKFLTLEYRTRLLHKEVDGSGTEGVSLLTALRQKPTKGLDEYMKLPEDDTYFDPDQLEEETLFDPKEESKRNYKKRINKSLNTMGAVTWDIMKGMTFRSEFGFENNSEEQRRFWGMETSKARSNNNQPVAEWSMKQGTKWQLTNVWNYNFMLKDVHDIRLMLGQEIKHNQTTTKTYSTRFFPENITAEKVFDNLSLGTPYENSSSAASPSRISSFFGRINYGYNDKYLATVTLRADGSSKFAKGNRWGFFPSVSVGWRLSEESFIKNNTQIFDNLKIRASYGVMGDDQFLDSSGNPQVLPFQYLTGYNYPGGTNYIFGSDVVNSLITKGLANTEYSWLTSKILNVGFDASLWNRKLEASVDVFYRKRDGLFAYRSGSLPNTFGASFPQENLNSDDFRGFELVLGHTNTVGDWTYSVKGNMSFTRAKNRHIEQADPINSYKNWTSNFSDRWNNMSFGYKCVGQFQDQEDINNWAIQDDAGNTTMMPGDLKYEDFNGDGVIDNNDIQPITRSNTPEIYFGLDLSASWKGFDFSLLMQGATNYNVYMSGCLGNAMFNGSNTLECFMDRWHREDLYDPESAWIPGKYPSTWNSGKPSNTRVSTFNHISSYYLRVKNIEFGYTFPKEWLSKVYVERLRLYVSGNNVLTFDNLPFGDPEAPSSDRILYPQLKIWNIGVNVTF